MMSKKKYKKLKKKYKDIAKGHKKKKNKDKDYSKLRYKGLPMYFKEGEKIVINRIHLTAHDEFLLKTYPDKYTTQSPTMYKEEVGNNRKSYLKKIAKREKEKELNEPFKLWNEYLKYKKNPEKYNKKKGMSKQERQILKYFNKIKSDKIKGSEIDEAIKKMKKCKDLSTLDLLLDDFEQRKLILELKRNGKKKGKKRNPNYMFSKNKYKNIKDDDRDMVLINALDEEINRRLMEDNIFSPNNIATDYEKHKKKKRKKMNIEDIII